MIPVAESPGARLLSGLKELSRRAETDPLAWMRWLPSQDAFLRCTDKRVLLRAGNQWGGKTIVLLSELIYRCLGYHPYKPVTKPPITAYLVTASWQQSLEIQRKLWYLLPKEQIDPETIFDAARGFRGKNPAIKFRNGSLLRIKTSMQGGLAQAGGTIHVIGIDEPVTSSRVYSELERRLTRTGGTLLMAMTPVNADCTFLRRLSEERKITDLHFPLTPENLVPIGCKEPMRTEDGIPMDCAWIEAQRESVLSWEAPVVLDGDWEFRAVDHTFERFDPDKHVSDEVPSGQVKLSLGVDYGEGNLRQVALLVAVDDSSDHEKIYVLDEYVSTTDTTTEDDAKAILAMLRRRGITWRQLDHVHGDRVFAGKSGSLAMKSNRRLQDEIEKELKIPPRTLLPMIRTAKRGVGRNQGSVVDGVRYVHEAMVRPEHFHVNPRCKGLIESFTKWKLGYEAHKDPVDALRYALIPWTYPTFSVPAAKVHFR